MKFEQLTIDLKSSIEQKGKVVTKIYTFVGGVKKTVRGVKTDTVIQGQFTKYETLDGRLVFINDNNVLSIEVFTDDKSSLS